MSVTRESFISRHVLEIVELINSKFVKLKFYKESRMKTEKVNSLENIDKNLKKIKYTKKNRPVLSLRSICTELYLKFLMK